MVSVSMSLLTLCVQWCQSVWWSEGSVRIVQTQAYMSTSDALCSVLHLHVRSTHAADTSFWTIHSVLSTVTLLASCSRSSSEGPS